MTNPVVLFRKSLGEEGEFEECKRHFLTCENRTFVPYGSLVMPRYSCLPYYQELEIDLENRGCTLINSYKQHKWIANFEWYSVLKEYTPETWFDDDFYRCNYSGPFVIKGKTNSKKFQWNTKMFARTKRDAVNVAGELMQDSMIGSQGIVYRKYVPLETFEIGINDLPFTNEWRFFCYKDKILSSGYYWSIAENVDILCDNKMLDKAYKIIDIVKDYVNFYVLDLAKTIDGDYILIEINDASMSGLSCNLPSVLYSNLKKELN